MNAIDDLHTPFGNQPLDMPGLSYVTGAAELSLRMIVGAVDGPNSTQWVRASSAGAPEKLFALLNHGLDKHQLLAPLDEDALPSRAEGAKPKALAEANEDERDEGGDE
jgi:hypothetical protein